LSPDGRWLALGPIFGEKGSVQLWEVASGLESEHKFESPPENYIGSLAWSPDGGLLACGNGNDANETGTVSLCDVVGGKEIRRFTGHRGVLWVLDFSPDGLRLASGSSDTTALIWDLRGLSRPEIQNKGPTTADALWGALRGKDPAVAKR